MDQHAERLIDIYSFMKAALEWCEVEIIEAQNAQGNAEILAIAKAMADDWGEFWTTFRAKWGIPFGQKTQTHGFFGVCRPAIASSMS